jgi:hypothetical protein
MKNGKWKIENEEWKIGKFSSNFQFLHFFTPSRICIVRFEPSLKAQYLRSLGHRTNHVNWIFMKNQTQYDISIYFIVDVNKNAKIKKKK